MTKESAFGTVLNMGDGDPVDETFSPIAQILDIEGPDLSVDTDDTTTHDSTGGWEDTVATILRSGEVTFDLVYDPADGTHDATSGLVSKMVSEEPANFQLVFPDAAETQWDFSAIVTGFKPKTPVSGKLAASVKMKITGQPTLA